MTTKERRFILHFSKPYIGNYFLYVLLIMIMTVFSICSVLSINNFLQILFSSNTSSSANVVKDTILNRTLNSIYDYFLVFGKSKALYIFCGIILGIYFLKDVFTYLSAYQIGYTRNKIIRNVRNSLFNKFLNQDLSFLSKYQKGDLLSRLSSDIIEYDETILKSIQNLISAVILILLYLTILFYIDYLLTISALILFPLILLVTSLISRKLRQTSKRLQTKNGYLVSIIQETLDGLRVIKSLSIIEFMNERFMIFNHSYTKLRNKVYRKVDLASPQSEFLSSIIVGVLLIIGSQNVLYGARLSPEMFIVYLILFVLIINPAKDASTAFYNMKRGTACINRIMSVVDSINDIKEPKISLDFPTIQKGITFKNVYFSYKPNEPVIKDLSLTFQKNQTTAIVGESGSGKTTIIDLIEKFYEINQGDILFDDVSIRDLSSKKIRDNISLVNQDTILFNDSVANNISFEDTRYTIQDIKQAASLANADEFIVNLPQGYQTNIQDKGNMLSGGQKQRLNIARAVLKNAQIFIFDEATSALDTKNEKLVQQAINEISKNKTTIIIAHRLSTIINADKIVVLNQGEIAAEGTHKELLSCCPIYQSLYQKQEL
jgi:ATP-binding cassette, subfamily B, bacterial MsbA